MIKEFEFYHGAVLAKIAQTDKKISINSYSKNNSYTYVINDKIGLYIKHCSNRMTPWSFSFARAHQDQIKEMADRLDHVFIALVCGKDGIACLSFDELKIILNHDHNDHEWVRVSRRPREKYAVKGSDGKLKFKIAYNHFPERIFQSSPGLKDLFLEFIG